MKNFLKSIFEVIVGLIIMIMGYGVVLTIFVPVIFLLCLAPVYLLVESIFSPNCYVFLLDGLLIFGFILSIKNKRINLAVKEVWVQMKAHL